MSRCRARGRPGDAAAFVAARGAEIPVLSPPPRRRWWRKGMRVIAHAAMALDAGVGGLAHVPFDRDAC